MISTMRHARLTLIVTATVAGWSPLAAAQSAPNACALLTDAEAIKLIARGQKTFSKPDATAVGAGKGSVCDYDHGQVGFWIGPNSEQNFEQFLKSWQQDKQPRQQISAVGDKAYVIYPKPRNKNSDQGPYIVVTVGPHLVTAFISARKGQADGPMGEMCRGDQKRLDDSMKKDCVRLLADKSEKPESLQPAIVELAKVLVAKVRSGSFMR